jgi:hypothetical protein
MPISSQERHRRGRIGWLSAAVLGANDGILSTSSLALGVAAAHATHSNVLVAGTRSPPSQLSESTTSSTCLRVMFYRRCSRIAIPPKRRSAPRVRGCSIKSSNLLSRFLVLVSSVAILTWPTVGGLSMPPIRFLAAFSIARWWLFPPAIIADEYEFSREGNPCH